MLLPETKEREYRFKLALRIGLPIFALVFILISSTLINTYESLHVTFYFTSILLLAFSIYFIFFLIYKGFDTKITEDVSKTFTRDYLYTYLNKELKNKKNYSLMLVSIDNLDDINTKYGLKNGDKVLLKVSQYLGKYLNDKNINNFPMGHIKAGDFIIGLEGGKENFTTILELLCLKSNEFKIDEIEVNISGAITDTSFSNSLDYLLENLFDIQNENRNKKNKNKEDISPSDLELFVINAINDETVVVITQDVYENERIVLKECFVKLKTREKKILHPKSYIKVVNKLGLRADYDYLILQKSINECVDDYNKMFSIIIDPTSLRNNNFLTKTKELLRDNPNVKNRIVFMISEVEYYSHTLRFNAVLQSLRKEGVKIAIDRLGSLHTSFLYLRELDVDIARFDSFYTKESTNKSIKSILDGFNMMIHNKNMKSWLKMIENDEAKKFAKDVKIDYVQGKALSSLIEVKI